MLSSMGTLGASFTSLWVGKIATATPRQSRMPAMPNTAMANNHNLFPRRKLRTPRQQDRPRQNQKPMEKAVSALVIRRHILKTRFSSHESERESYGSGKLFVVKRFGQEGRSTCVQGGGTNQRIVLSRKDDDARRRQNFGKPRLNFQAAH